MYIFNRIQRKKSGWRIGGTNKKIDIKILDLNTIISIITLNELNLKRENFRFNKMQDPVYTACNIYTINVKMYVVHTKWLQSCLSLCDSMGYSPPGSSIRGILQARILERAAMPSSSRSSWLRDWTWVSYVSCIDKWVLYH